MYKILLYIKIEVFFYSYQHRNCVAFHLILFKEMMILLLVV